MNIFPERIFKNIYKKLHPNQVPAVNDAINEIINNPTIGELKKGDLAGIQVYKFYIQNQLYLLSYTVEDEDLILLALGVHQNFYNKLKK